MEGRQNFNDALLKVFVPTKPTLRKEETESGGSFY
jgi:hypothetical protein